MRPSSKGGCSKRLVWRRPFSILRCSIMAVVKAMTTKIVIALSLAAASLAASGTSGGGADRLALDGHWEGAITQPAGALKISLDVTTQPDAVRGSFTLPAAAVFRWPVTIQSASPKISFKLPGSGL